MRPRREVTSLSLEAGARDWRVVAGYRSHPPRTVRRTNTKLSAEAELQGLARRHGLKLIEPVGRGSYLSATKTGHKRSHPELVDGIWQIRRHDHQLVGLFATRKLACAAIATSGWLR